MTEADTTGVLLALGSNISIVYDQFSNKGSGPINYIEMEYKLQISKSKYKLKLYFIAKTKLCCCKIQ